MLRAFAALILAPLSLLLAYLLLWPLPRATKKGRTT